ncbi:DUF3373 domain-containing protein [Sulfurimonas sp. HSL-3221]|uniref:DUF3373 family protein n=1 Tax=Sulfurimonadaceae TaxID=2771471 RepID=UPI001E52BE5C|nr:DUF3373 family protein [Sulfurimonas sp. HSL-3221]UFS62288.1 DUF3373 domain-containing protein [Sulfurimonas sp. HSL-3221]
MKKQLILSVAAAAILSIGLQADETTDRMEAMEAQIEALQEQLSAMKDAKADETAATEDDEEGSEEEVDETDERLTDLEEQVSTINRNTSGSHLKFGVDFRTAVDNLNYKMAGNAYNPDTMAFDGDDTQSNDAFLTNRLWLNMEWLATENMSFTAQLAYNKAYGYRSGFNGGYPGFETFDWITNENAYDDVVRVRSAYFFYRNDTFLGAEIPWTFSIGRRPSTNGHLINLRDDDRPASPMGHNINVEFDGMSSKFSFEDLTGIDGMYIKFCAGRGGTNANAKFFTINMDSNNTLGIAAPYAKNDADLPDIDLGGLIFVPYDDGQYSLGAQYYYAAHLIDASVTPTPSGYVFHNMQDVGNMHAVTANFMINGIGNGWSDFLDDTIFFASGAVSITDPKKGAADQGMLGSKESKTGSSYWVGLQIPTLFTDMGRIGFEYNHGDKYWRSITYAEDTNIGSKVATRGSAYEAYYTDYLIEDVFSFQIRYTYIDYEYTGSNGFFGSTTGTPYKIDDLAATNPGLASATVDKAQDIRFYLRYRY